MTTTTKNPGTLTALTVTNLQSLTNGAYWQSAVIDNSTIKALWAEIFLTIVTTTTAASAIGAVQAYIAAYNSVDTAYVGGASGSEGTYTIVGDSNDQLQSVGRVRIDATETTARTYRTRLITHDLPDKFAVILLNNTGQALGTGNAVAYQLNTFTNA